MPLITINYEIDEKLILSLRLISGLVWLGTVFRRLTSNYGNFEERITDMADGTTILPDFIMELAVDNWFLIYLLVISLEIISSISLLTGTFTRGGAFVATINGFGIGMAGLGLGLMDLIIPWSVAIITLFLLLFTHPGRYMGIDSNLSKRNLPNILKKLT